MSRFTSFTGRGFGASMANLIAVLVLYFAVPVRLTPTGRVAFGLLFSACAVVAVSMLVMREARAQRDDSNHQVGLVPLLILLEVVTMAFALGYYVLAQHTGQIDGIHTRIDALYFTTVTMTSVGYGDIHPVGQLARAIVLLNLLFNVFFLAALTRLAGGHLSRMRS